MVTVYVGSSNGTNPFELVHADLNRGYEKTDAQWATWFQCKPTRDEHKNLFLVRSPNDVIFDRTPISEIERHATADGIQRVYEQAWLDAPCFEVAPDLYLYSDTPLDISVTSAYNHDTGANRDGFIVDARICINAWYRRMRIVQQLYPKRERASWHAGDPLCYVRFHTSEHITFVPYVMTDELYELERERQQWQLVERHVPNRPEGHVDRAQAWLDDHASDRASFNDRVLSAIGRVADV